MQRVSVPGMMEEEDRYGASHDIPTKYEVHVTNTLILHTCAIAPMPMGVSSNSSNTSEKGLRNIPSITFLVCAKG